MEKFLSEGHKVKVTIMFRGRETQHPELGRRILDNVADRVGHLARVEVVPKLDGRNMVMVLAPDKKARAQWEARQRAEADGDGTPASTAATTTTAAVVPPPTDEIIEPDESTEITETETTDQDDAVDNDDVA